MSQSASCLNGHPRPCAVYVPLRGVIKRLTGDMLCVRNYEELLALRKILLVHHWTYTKIFLNLSVSAAVLNPVHAANRQNTNAAYIISAARLDGRAASTYCGKDGQFAAGR